MPAGINRHWEQHRRGGCGPFIFGAPPYQARPVGNSRIPAYRGPIISNTQITGRAQNSSLPEFLHVQFPEFRNSRSTEIPEFQASGISKLQNSRTPEFQNYRITGLRNCVIMELHRKHHERGVRYSRIFEGVRLPFATRWGDP